MSTRDDSPLLDLPEDEKQHLFKEAATDSTTILDSLWPFLINANNFSVGIPGENYLLKFGASLQKMIQATDELDVPMGLHPGWEFE